MIKEYRKLNKLTQLDLAKMAGMARTTVQWCEKNENKMTPQVQLLRKYIRHAYAYQKVAESYRKPMTQPKPRLSFFARLKGWLKCW